MPFGPASGFALPIAVFVAAVFAISGWAKRRPEWALELAAYGLWDPASSKRLAAVARLIEIVTCFSLLVLGYVGLAIAGFVFVTYGLVLTSARLIKYEGPCGCSANDVVSDAKALRAWPWAAALLGLGVSHYQPDLAAAISIAAAAILLEVALFVGSLLLAPGPRSAALIHRAQAPS